MDNYAGLAVIHIRTFHRANAPQLKRSTVALPNRRFLRPEVSERLSCEAEGVPVVHGEGTEGAVEVDGGLIPLKDAPLDT